MGTLTEEMQGSAALQLVISQGWNWKNVDPNQIEIELETCPFCKKLGYGHFYMEIHGTASARKNRDGLYLCHRCGKSGNLNAMRMHLGLVNPQLESSKTWATGEAVVDKLPDVEQCHAMLLQDIDAMDYLMHVRGFSRAIIEKQKIGLVEKHYFRNVGEVKALVFPYLVNGNIVWCHYRSLPDVNDLDKVPKAFNGPRGWEALLYNGGILKAGLKEILLVEGEADCIAALDNGLLNTCGVPGANIKKAEWIDTLDNINPKIYILYDADKTGQKAAQSLASRIGIERCWKIVLPEFKIDDGDLGSRFGKDLNEWFRYGGGSLEAFEQLKLDAGLFDVDGVASTQGALDEFMDELDGKGAGQRYLTPWPSLSAILRFDEGEVIDILAPEKIGKSKLAMNFVEFMVETYGEDGVIISLEMTRAKLVRSWLSHKARIADVLTKTPEEEQALTQAFKEAIPGVKEMAANREGNLYFCYPRYREAEDIYKLIIECIRRYGVKWIVVDNLQLLCDATIGNRARTQYLSEISKALAKIAKDYKVQMVRILQPHRIAAGKIANSDSVDGSSQVAKDCDCQIVLNRPRIGEVDKQKLDEGGYIQTEGAFSPEMLVTVGLSRYSAGGSTTLYFDGATSSVYELAEGKIAAMNAKAYKATIGNQIWKTGLSDLTPIEVSI